MIVARTPEAYWAAPVGNTLKVLESNVCGLSSAQGADRLKSAPRAIGDHRISSVALLLRQFRSPIVLLLIGAAILSFVLHETVDAIIIISVILLSAVLGFFQEHGAVQAVEALRQSVRVRVKVLRDGSEMECTLTEIVMGDVVLLSAGDVVPGDGILIQSNQLQVDESVLTGESFPRSKEVGVSERAASVSDRSNCLHLGSHVVSGVARMLVVSTGTDTEYGKVAEHVGSAHVPTAFERGATSFGLLLLKSTVVLVVAVFAINIALSRTFIESLLFSLALAVGLTPQILPAIITVSLSTGASFMARKHVIVKRLDAIEDIGGLDVLYTDKTGTITVGTVELRDAVSIDGKHSNDVSNMAFWNASLQTGYRNPIDDAIVTALRRDNAMPDVAQSCGEIPYDFDRKRLSVWVQTSSESLLVVKGAVAEVLSVCTSARAVDGMIIPLEEVEEAISETFHALSTSGFRVLGVACKSLNDRSCVDNPLLVDDECEMTFSGFVVLVDPPKTDAREAIDGLRSLGVDVRIITGDNRHAAEYVAKAVGISADNLLTGEEVEAMDDRRLREAVERTTVFAETSPLIKERIVRACTRAGHSVGYLGDGINDAPALRIADVGISVDTAVGVAKQVADVVLLEKDLGVLMGGISEGRRVFANTLKYVHVTTSAAFGNVLSLALATVILPFLPMMPTQILVLNFLSDLPGLTISTDRVDSEQLSRPVEWDIRRIRNFMIVFGLVSTAFDLLTFLFSRHLLHAAADLTRSVWFVESALTEIVVMLVLRTRRPFFRSRPSSPLLLSSVVMAVMAIGLPFSPLATDLGFVGIPIDGVLLIAALVVTYLIVTETLKLRLTALTTLTHARDVSALM